MSRTLRSEIENPWNESPPDAITVIIDTRERDPYKFDSRLIKEVRLKLLAGDYTVAGMEDVIAIERKTRDDFVGTVMQEYDRFKRELERLQKYIRALIVVEANLSEIGNHDYYSTADPEAVIRRKAEIEVNFGVPVQFCSDRQHACRFVQNFLLCAAQKRELWNPQSKP